MPEVTVKSLADTVKVPVVRLLQQMQEAGLPHSAEADLVSDEQKQQLLVHLKNAHGQTAGAPKRVTVKRRVSGTLRTGKGGRGPAVKVQMRRKRSFERPAEAAEAPPPPAATAKPPSGAEGEAERIRAEEHKRKEAEEARQQELRTKAAEDARKAEEAKREQARREAEELAARQAKEAEEVARAAAKGAAEDPTKAAAEAAAKAQAEARAAESGNRRAPGKGPARSGDRRDKTRRSDDFGEGRTRRRELSLKKESRRAKRRGQPLSIERQGGEFTPQEVTVREVEIGAVVSVGELAQRMSVKAGEVIKTLMGMGVMATINQPLDQDTAVLVVEEMGHTVKLIAEDAIEQEHEQSLQVEGAAQSRPPVVTVMGHVDHGKTSLLDYIRHTRVVAGEAGGITQHIGAYHVDTDHGSISFIDTPGHAAFSAMRARGASATDIVVLVVAADDGVMPQTEEAVNHSRAAEVPVIVAVNKMDLEGADPERVKNELSALDVIPEDWGGDTQFVEVSAETGQGIDSLLEAITLQAELLELTAVSDAPGRGTVIESRLDRGRGPVATVLVQNGTLRKGDVIIAGECFGRVRAMMNERGEAAPDATPSTPVEVLGLNGTPGAGDSFSVVTDERSARELAEFRADRSQEQRLATQKAATLESMFANLGKGEKRVLKLVVKADVRGSLEAIVQACAEIGNDEVAVNILGSGVGGITESDANMAFTYGAAVFGFNTRADTAAKIVIEREGMDLRYYSVIYELVDDIKQILEGMLEPEVREEIVGTAEVRDVFRSPRFGQVAGCMVLEGAVFRNKKIRVLRDNVVIYEGELESLRRFKDDVMEVRGGLECGIGVRNYNDVRAGDKIEVFDSREVARAL